MRELREKWEDALFWATPQVNRQMIEYLGYSLIDIITRIQLLHQLNARFGLIHSLPS